MSEAKPTKSSKPAAESARDASERASRLGPLDYFRSVSAVLRPTALRDWFSRDSMATGLKTLAWVAPLTILIWVYAEREQQADMTGQTIPFEVEMPASSNKVASVTMPSERLVMVDFRGPRAQLDAIKSLLARGGSDRVRLELDPNLSAEPHELAVVPLLERSDFLRKYGVAVLNASPARIRVVIDEVDEVQIPVRNPPDARILDEGSVFNPSTVTFRGPKKLIPSGTVETNPMGWAGFFVYPTGFEEQLKQTDRKEVSITKLPLKTAFAAEDVSLSPATVDATFRLKEEDVQYTLPDGVPLPVWRTLPPQSDDFEIEYDPTLSRVTFVGPPHLIEAIRNGEVVPAPKARIELTDVDLTQREVRKPVVYDLPKGVRVSSQDQNKQITVQITRRPAD